MASTSTDTVWGELNLEFQRRGRNKKTCTCDGDLYLPTFADRGLSGGVETQAMQWGRGGGCTSGQAKHSGLRERRPGTAPVLHVDPFLSSYSSEFFTALHNSLPLFQNSPQIFTALDSSSQLFTAVNNAPQVCRMSLPLFLCPSLCVEDPLSTSSPYSERDTHPEALQAPPLTSPHLTPLSEHHPPAPPLSILSLLRLPPPRVPAGSLHWTNSPVRLECADRKPVGYRLCTETPEQANVGLSESHPQYSNVLESPFF